MNDSHGQCEICHEHEFKYTCPRCKLHSCSLDCFNKHKAEKPCSGLSDASLGTRDSYIDKKTMKMDDVQRDYNFLLKVNRSLELTKRKRHDLKTMTQKRGKTQLRRNFSSRAQGERAQSWIMQRGVRVMKVPFGMERGKINKSSGKGNNWSWTVEWLFVDSQMKILQKYTRYRSSESATLRELVPEGWIATNDDGTQEKFRIFIKNLDERNVYEELSPALKLSEAIVGRLVVEFPTLYLTKENITTNASFKVVPLDSCRPDGDSRSDSESNESTSSSSSGSDTSSGSDSDSDSDSDPDSVSGSGSGSDSDEAPEETSSKKPLQD